MLLLSSVFILSCTERVIVPASVDGLSVSASSESAASSNSSSSSAVFSGSASTSISDPPTAIVSWLPPAVSNGLDAPTGYRVYRAANDRMYQRIADVGADINNWIDYDARLPVSFYFVTAYNTAGESDPSDIVSKRFQ